MIGHRRADHLVVTITRTAPEARLVPRKGVEHPPPRKRRLLLRLWDRMKAEALHLLPSFVFLFLAAAGPGPIAISRSAKI